MSKTIFFLLLGKVYMRRRKDSKTKIYFTFNIYQVSSISDLNRNINGNTIIGNAQLYIYVIRFVYLIRRNWIFLCQFKCLLYEEMIVAYRFYILVFAFYNTCIFIGKNSDRYRKLNLNLKKKGTVKQV